MLNFFKSAAEQVTKLARKVGETVAPNAMAGRYARQAVEGNAAAADRLVALVEKKGSSVLDAAFAKVGTIAEKKISLIEAKGETDKANIGHLVNIVELNQALGQVAARKEFTAAVREQAPEAPKASVQDFVNAFLPQPKFA